jgi:hypothetical protein
MYVDENGNHNLREDLTKDSNRYLCVTGVAMYLSEHDTLEQQIDALKTKYFGKTDIVLHRREIISGKEPFEALKDQDVRDNFNVDLLNIISVINYRVFSIVIDKKAHIDKYGIFMARDPYVIALEYLMQRYQYWMQRFRKPVLGDILAESRGGREDRVLKEAYKFVYEGKGYYSLKNANQYYSSKEIKLKKKKDNIAGLQFVDILSHPSRRYILSQKKLARDIKADSYEQKIVEILIKDKFSCKDGIIEGNGAVFFPK